MSLNSPNSNPNPNPDLDESIDVAEAHGRVALETAASAREKRLADNGHEPISLWVIAACGIVLLVAGSVLGSSGTWFKYDGYFREGYVRGSAEGTVDSGPKPKTALAAFSAKGSKIYGAKCSGCHNPSGSGDGVNYPSLAGSEWVTGDTQKFAMIILNGLQGPTSTGKVYGAGVMPAQGTGMSAEDLASVMTFLRNGFGNSTGDVVSPEMAANAIDISGSRDNPGSSVNAEEIVAKHMVNLPGEYLDPTTMVNPATFAPIE